MTFITLVEPGELATILKSQFRSITYSTKSLTFILLFEVCACDCRRGSTRRLIPVRVSFFWGGVIRVGVGHETRTCRRQQQQGATAGSARA